MNTHKISRSATRRGPLALARDAALALSVLGLAGAAPALTVVAESSFTTGNDGWGIGTLFAAEIITTPVLWQATGGDPGGYIRNSESWTHIAFEAPDYFLGDRSALFLEGSIRFDRWADIEVPGTTSGGEVMLVISNGSLNLQFVTGAPFPAWSDGNQVVFDATHGWEVAPTTFAGQGGRGVPATNEQMLSVLSNLTAIRFPARFVEGGVATGTVALDSVQLLSPVPEPHAALLMAVGAALLAARRRRVDRA